jgi:hypothetical protein
VILSFESKYGPLRYATGEFTATGRTGNEPARDRALDAGAARGRPLRRLEARRAIHRLARRSRSRPTRPDSLRTREQAQEFLDSEYGGDLRRALFETHPDRGGDGDEFRRVVRAKELLAG